MSTYLTLYQERKNDVAGANEDMASRWTLVGVELSHLKIGGFGEPVTGPNTYLLRCFAEAVNDCMPAIRARVRSRMDKELAEAHRLAVQEVAGILDANIEPLGAGAGLHVVGPEKPEEAGEGLGIPGTLHGTIKFLREELVTVQHQLASVENTLDGCRGVLRETEEREQKVAVERDRALTALSDLRDAHKTVEEDRTNLGRRLGDLRLDREKVVDECDRALTLVQDREADRDALKKSLENCQESKAAMAERLDAVTAERDRLLSAECSCDVCKPPKRPAKSAAGYGYCPKCGSPGITRERRYNGNDQCRGGHTYPSRDALPTPPRAPGEPGTDNPV